MTRRWLTRMLISFAAASAIWIQASALAQSVTVVEYRNKTLDAYFITGRAAEQALLDTVADFSRTGMSFQAASAATSNAALTRICRFYVNVVNPFVNSHFYGRQGSDCELILGLNLAGFTYEGYDFAVTPPQASSEVACPVNTLPVYRSFRALASGKTSNHRYTVSAATYAIAAAAGYVGEGIQFCALSAADIGAVARSWTGTATGALSSAVIGASATASVSWTLSSVVGNLAVYKPTGTVTAAFTSLVGCVDVPVLDPQSHTLDPATDGILTVDYTTTPPRYYGSGLSSWPATLTCTDTNGRRASIPGYEGQVDFFGGSGGATGVEAAGRISNDGTTIEGSDARSVGELGQQTFRWKFVRTD